MTETMCSLPEDMMREIISRVSMKDMRAVRLTCKKWETLSKSRAFTKMHIGKLGQVESSSRMVVLMDHSLYLMSVVVDDDHPPSSERKGKLACLDDSGQVIRFSQIFYCDGLLLCILEDDTRVVVWNPYWGQTRWIQPTFSYRISELDRFTYALGYVDNKSCRRHKFLRFIDLIDYQLFGRVDPLVQASLNPLLQAYEIYDFDSYTWKTLVVDPYWRKPYSHLGVSLKGNTYWVATKRNSPMHRLDHIICFDFTRERFGPLLPLPSGPKSGIVGLVTLSCVKQEKLAALFYYGQPYPNKAMGIEIWITSKVEAERYCGPSSSLWIRVYILPFRFNLFNPVSSLTRRRNSPWFLTNPWIATHLSSLDTLDPLE